MKKIISGIRYDTEKATLIGTAESPEHRRNPHHWKESLFVSPRQAHYFLMGSGGPFTWWSNRCAGGKRVSGEGIKPISKKEALLWAERYLGIKVIDEYFGGLVEDA